MNESSGIFSQLQHLLQLSYSDKIEDQQKTAMELSKLVETTVFPVVSFGPLSHALCRLLPSSNRTVSSYSARALKLLLLDDALRSQANVAGVPIALANALKQWEDEILCIREILGGIQTLCWDKQCVKGIIQADIIMQLIEYLQAPDQEISVMAVATLANILVFVDSLLLTDAVVIEALGTAIIPLIEILKLPPTRPQRFYAAAALANASSHPRLVSLINQQNGFQLFRDIDIQSQSNVHIIGSKIGECAKTAIYKLSDRREGDVKYSLAKYNFKWGTRPVMELSIAQYGLGKICICFSLWMFVLLFIITPSLFGFSS